LERQLRGTPPESQDASSLPTSDEAVRKLLELRKAPGKEKDRLKKARKELYEAEVAARLATALTSQRPFVERLIHFWSNIFTVSVARKEVLGLAGSFERTVIRPRALGRFEDMLIASTQHQAMQIYLDNVRSSGPRSPFGQRKGQGLNENLAREVLELHTLGVDGGYSQADVLALAKLLTGWGIERARRQKGPSSGAPAFDRRRHEPGSKLLLGRRYEEGEEGGIQALRDLANHPSTAHHVARRMAAHFVGSAPPRSLVHRLSKAFRRSRGNLRALALALIEAPELWTNAPDRVKSHWDFVVSTARALEIPRGEERFLAKGLAHLGQLPWSAPSPAGWNETSTAWIGPESLLRRVEWGLSAAQRWAGPRDGSGLLQEALLNRCSPATRLQVAATDKPKLSIALVLASPEFQRR
jgi:uncharacterized protein (DUF1800 family)